VTFDPQDRKMSRDRGQLLFRYRPGQTFDHAGGYTAQVRQYARDDTYDGPVIDQRYLVDEAMHLVRRWRSDGLHAPGAADGSNRAPEFPSDAPLAEQHYEVVIPGKVFAAVWPRVVRCVRASCGLVWEADDPRPGVDNWPPACPACRNLDGNRQLQFVFVHQCGELLPMRPPRECGRGHSRFRLNDRVSRFKDFRWECLVCRMSLNVQAFCPNSICAWPNKLMQPLLHTASSAHSGQGVTVVNPPLESFAEMTMRPAFVAATIARWLGLIDDAEADRLLAHDTPATPVPPEVIASIEAMERAGLVAEANRLRAVFAPAAGGDLEARVAVELGWDPLDDEDARGRALARNVSVYHRVLKLERLTIPRLIETARRPDRRAVYARYPAVLSQAGFDPDGTYLITDFPVIYLGVGYTRGGFGPQECDLVAYRGRAARGQQLTTLIYANPASTEALLFNLDRSRVSAWLVANELATRAEIDKAGGVQRWFASRLDPRQGHYPVWPAEPPPGHPDLPAYHLFGLLHTMAHQVLRALAVDSGYSETSLSEYLFPYDLAFAIHPNGARDFTIGALRTVLEQNLDQIVERAMDNDSCLYDPHCMLTNRGADHGCLYLPETACQLWNRNLSRWHLYGSPNAKWTGYWAPSLYVGLAQAAAQ
jgi:hypothetical protein